MAVAGNTKKAGGVQAPSKRNTALSPIANSSALLLAILEGIAVARFFGIFEDAGFIE